MTVPERRIVAGSRDVCFGNPANGQSQRIMILDFNRGPSAVLCPRRTNNGLCNVGESPFLPCTQGTTNLEPLEVEVGAGLIRHNPQTRMVEKFPGLTEPVHVSKLQSGVLIDLMQHPGIVRPALTLYPGDPRFLPVVAYRLRQRLQDTQHVIQTIPNIGLRLGP